MNKVLAFIMVCAMALSLSAASKTTQSVLLFNRWQFQHAKAQAGITFDALTVPMVYKGSFDIEGWFVWDNDNDKIESMDNDCLVDDVKLNLPMYMTMCQPCIDCFPCTMLGTQQTQYQTPAEVASASPAVVGDITRWNIYVVQSNKKQKWAYVWKLNVLDAAAANGAYFFTGAQKGKAVFQYSLNNGSFFLTGNKSDYTFKFYNAEFDFARIGSWTWTNPVGNKATAYIKSVSSFEGDYALAEMWHQVSEEDYVGYQFEGTIKLNRDAALTKSFIDKAFSGSFTTYIGQGWEDCIPDTSVKPNYCEYQFNAWTEDENDSWLDFENESWETAAVADNFDKYLAGTFKNYEDVTFFTSYGLDSLISDLLFSAIYY